MTLHKLDEMDKKLAEAEKSKSQVMKLVVFYQLNTYLIREKETLGHLWSQK